jgi:phosphoglycerate dehydrogenase-like enzyme
MLTDARTVGSRGVLAAVPESTLEIVRAYAPRGVEVRPVSGDLDAVAFLVVSIETSYVMERLHGLPQLRVVQVLSAGTDGLEDLIPPGVTLCNARGARDVAVAEWVVGALLGDASGLLHSAARQHERAWTRYQPAELAGSTVLILGHGSIGEAVRRRLQALRVEVVAVAAHARPGVHAVEELDELIPAADAVVMLAPLTEATRGMVDAAFLARMRDGALLVNAGRGATVDTGALVRETASGRLRAVLDVVDPEPLPADHPLWTTPGVTITPHVAGDSAPAERRAARLAGEQLARFARGEPLRNVVFTASARA